MELISKNLSMEPDSPNTHIDSRDFLLLLKHLNELRKDVLDNKEHEITPQSFLVFIDKISNLTNFEKLNEFIMRKLSSINVDLLNSENMLNSYHKHSVDYRFEENLRIEEIKKFANGVVPEARFLFDNYKVTNLNEARSLEDRNSSYEAQEQASKMISKQTSLSKVETDDEDSGLEDNKPKFSNADPSSIQQYSEPDDYFSFFSSHEKLLLRPEKTFKHLRKFLKYLPVDYYVLLQENFESKTKFEETNYVMFRNLPIIAKNLTKFQRYEHRQLSYEDITR